VIHQGQELQDLRSFGFSRRDYFQNCLIRFLLVSCSHFSLNGQLHQVWILVRPFSAFRPETPCSNAKYFPPNLGTSAPGQVLSLSALLVFLFPKSCARPRLAPSNLPSPSPARTPALESCYRQFALQCICINPFVFHVSPSSVLCRGRWFRTPERSRLRPIWAFPRG